jgi:hypothetical protein
MVATAQAGTAPQHTILLWPFHLMVIAVALAQLPARWSTGLAALLCLSNLAVTRQYYEDLRHDGPAIRWSDAMDPLEHYLEKSRPERIFIADWGIIETLSLLSEGRLPVYYADAARFTWNGANSGEVFVAHTPEFTFTPSVRAELAARASAQGLKEQTLTTVVDSKQRPTFEVFKFVKP